MEPEHAMEPRMEPDCDVFCCDVCGYKTSNKQNMLKHMNRRTSCDVNAPKAYSCEKCNREFTHRQSMYRHYKTCTVPTGSSNVTTTTTNTNNNNTTTNNTNSNNTTNNTTNTNSHNVNVTITYNSFGRETVAHLTPQFLSRCVMRRDKGLVDLLDKLHFDEQVPQNNNVRIPNMKQPVGQVRNETGEWTYMRKDKLLNQMYDRGSEILQEHFDDYQYQLRNATSQTMWEYIVKWMASVEDRDKNMIKDILVDIYVMLLNRAR